MANIYCQVCGGKKGIFDKTCKNCGHVFLTLESESQNAPGMEALWQEAPVMEPSEELHEEGQTELPANLPGGGQGQKAIQQPTRQSRRSIWMTWWKTRRIISWFTFIWSPITTETVSTFIRTVRFRPGRMEIQKKDQLKKVVWTIDLTDLGGGSFVETSVFEGWGK